MEDPVERFIKVPNWKYFNYWGNKLETSYSQLFNEQPEFKIPNSPHKQKEKKSVRTILGRIMFQSNFKLRVFSLFSMIENRLIFLQ